MSYISPQKRLILPEIRRNRRFRSAGRHSTVGRRTAAIETVDDFTGTSVSATSKQGPQSKSKRPLRRNFESHKFVRRRTGSTIICLYESGSRGTGFQRLPTPRESGGLSPRRLQVSYVTNLWDEGDTSFVSTKVKAEALVFSDFHPLVEVEDSGVADVL